MFFDVILSGRAAKINGLNPKVAIAAALLITISSIGTSLDKKTLKSAHSLKKNEK